MELTNFEILAVINFVGLVIVMLRQHRLSHLIVDLADSNYATSKAVEAYVALYSSKFQQIEENYKNLAIMVVALDTIVTENEEENDVLD